MNRGMAQNPETARHVYDQLKEAKQDIGSRITCGCGTRMRQHQAYKCFYCGVFFCEKCAAEHFGKTKDEYYADKTVDYIAGLQTAWEIAKEHQTKSGVFIEMQIGHAITAAKETT